ncbi:MAG: LysM peptidoglycan-binding domain-containing protein [Bacteroidales bacterium]|nr:LysM peptidoglycan-binding domain-containing protein [Bacteroidales bacterium]
MDSSGDNFTFIHACNRGVIISSLSETYYSERFLGARRVIPDFDSRGRKSQLDTIFIKASASDRQIVLFGDGTWSYLEKDGRLTPPNPKETITLDATGVWTTTVNSNANSDTTATEGEINVQGRIIPTLPPSENENAATDTLSTRNTETQDANTENTRNSKAKYHTIKKGDTLYSLAKKYGTTVEKICDLNGISSKTVLNVGRKLRVK